MHKPPLGKLFFLAKMNSICNEPKLQVFLEFKLTFRAQVKSRHKSLRNLHENSTYMTKRVYPSITFATMKLQDKISIIQTSKCVNKAPIRPSTAGSKYFLKRDTNPSDDEK